MSNEISGLVGYTQDMHTHSQEKVRRGTREEVENTYHNRGEGMLHLVKRSSKFLPFGEME